MEWTVGLREDLLGQRPATVRWVVPVATGLFFGGVALAAIRAPVDLVGWTTQFVLVLLGFVLAVVAVAQGAGLVSSWLLSLAPAMGGVAFNTWEATQRGTQTIALPLSFGGQGALTQWLAIGLLLGTVWFLTARGVQWHTRRRRYSDAG